jgi:predicted tellurium resistance membrane protein TerC
VLQFWQFEVLGAAYLLWLVFKHFTAEAEDGTHHHGPRFSSLWQAIPVIAFTDLAFSLDSVTTALALSKDIAIILLGGMIGVITLRFMAGLFIHWLEEFEHLEDAGFVTVAFVGLRLLVRVINPDIVPPQWVMVALIAAVFAWGFSKRIEVAESISEATVALDNANSNGKMPVITELELASHDDTNKVANAPQDNPEVEYAEPS